MSHHRYAIAALLADYFRAGIGLSLTAGLALFTAPSPAVRYLLGGVAVLFLVYAVRTLSRHFTLVELSDAGIRAIGPFGMTLKWADLKGMDLRYFSTRRDRGRGWMQLRLKSEAGKLALDSGLDDFAMLARRAAAELSARGLALTPATRANLEVLGPSRHRHEPGIGRS